MRSDRTIPTASKSRINKGADGIPLDGVAFHPYHTSKDLVGIIVFLMIFSAVVFFAPDMGGYFLEHANFEPANLTATPEHIAPVWYFTPFYAILRAVPDKLWGFHPVWPVSPAAIVLAVAGSLAGEIDSLSRLDLQIRTVDRLSSRSSHWAGWAQCQQSRCTCWQLGFSPSCISRSSC